MNFEAGPELDAFIAENIFGWQWKIRNGICYIDAQNCWLVFQPSTNIGDAWKVVEKMKDGFRFSMYHLPSISSAGFGWHVAFELTIHRPSTVPMEDNYIGGPDTASLAICLAAVKVIRI